MDEEFIPTLSHATERDIDLLLVEELHASFDFVTWMAGQVGFHSRISSWNVKHSKRRTRSRREIDIFVEIDHENGKRSVLLIENKLDATEQPDQAESYLEELKTLAEDRAQAAIIIVCPDAYAEKYPSFTSKFHAVVSYETIGAYLRELQNEAGSEMVLRYGFRSELLDQAIYKHRRGYTPIPDKTVGDFNARYVALLKKVAPEIEPGPSMLKLENPRESTSMIFDQKKTLAGLPSEIRPKRFAHELGRGSDRRANYVAVTFAGWGAASRAILDQLVRDTADLGASFAAKPSTKVRPNPGLVMMIPTAPVDNQGDFDAQIEGLEKGILVAAQMRKWLLSHQDVLLHWRRSIETH